MTLNVFVFVFSISFGWLITRIYRKPKFIWSILLPSYLFWCLPLFRCVHTSCHAVARMIVIVRVVTYFVKYHHARNHRYIKTVVQFYYRTIPAKIHPMSFPRLLLHYILHPLCITKANPHLYPKHFISLTFLQEIKL